MVNLVQSNVKTQSSSYSYINSLYK